MLISKAHRLLLLDNAKPGKELSLFPSVAIFVRLLLDNAKPGKELSLFPSVAIFVRLTRMRR
jgi:hypothetical protein